MLKPLPIGTSTFRKIIEGGFLYVDKSRYIYELVQHPVGIYFLSRPRRFGKSLLISTLHELFQGQRQLFKGLWIDEQTDYKWPVHPVIRIDFGVKHVSSADELKQFLDYELQRIAREHSLELHGYDNQTRFQDLIRQLSHERGVVILVDEYDKPILDNIHDLDEAKQILTVLKGFYGVIKALDAHIRFVLISGISKFSKVSIFSDLNNLEDLTLQRSMSASLGLTEDELQHNFQGYIQSFATEEGVSKEELLEKIRHWYNGFCFAPEGENVYNPFSTLLLFKTRRFTNHWFETGTPTFIVKLIHENSYDVEQLDSMEVQEFAFSTYEIERLAILPLLVQTGYLTIKSYDKENRFYRLSYPNYEVEDSFLSYLLDAFSNAAQGLSKSYLQKLITALTNQDLNSFFEVLKVLYANIDYDLQIASEKYYQTIFFLIFKLIGLQIHGEVKTNKGRIDAVIELDDHVYIFEFKINQSAAIALDQIHTTEYYQKYQLHNKAITSVGANFDTELRTISDWASETQAAPQ